MTSIMVRFPGLSLQARIARRISASGTSRKRRLTHLTAAQGPEADCGKPTNARSRPGSRLPSSPCNSPLLLGEADRVEIAQHARMNEVRARRPQGPLASCNTT